MAKKKSFDKSQDKSFFEPVDTKVNFPMLEKEIFKYWKEKDIVKKYLQKNENSKKRFSFLDGPITANNPMGVHHAWGRTYKDLWQRYKNMQGFKQRFQNGFDAQGLWVEVEVEKELSFKTKKDIEKFGVKKFVDLCKKRVLKYSKIQTNQSKRLGYFMDWDNSYYTMSDDNNYLIWHFLKVCHNNGWLYKGNDSVPWCPRCETAISQHEILTEDYKELTHKSIVLEFPIVGRKDEYLLVWTTTPWTIPANIAVAVDKDLDYALVKGDEKGKYWLAKDAIKRIFGKAKEPIKVVKGRKLVDLKYRGGFDDLPAVQKVAKKNPEKFHTVVATDQRIMPVTTDEGTGLVHTAVSAGTEDFKLGEKLGLPMIPVIRDDASYLEGFGNLSDKNAKENPQLIFDYLQEKEKEEGEDWVFDIFDYKHRYPVCWRCKTELVWKVTDEWYIAMDSPSKKEKDKSSQTLRERMKGVARNIKWIPSFGLKRELDWLDNMHDWLISKKNRYWGLALPIWECESCGAFDVIGSKEELKKRAVTGWKKFEGKSPHKPQIDQVKIKCSKCGKLASRIEPVGNPWLDAGIVAYSTVSENNKAATLHSGETKPLYLTDKKKWREWFPADFITESFPGQFKNWFYSLIAMSTVLEDEEPFKTVLGFATLLAEDGRAMHKSLGNAIEFSEGADKIGVDVMRWMYVRQNPSENLLFGYKNADEARRRFHLKLWNVYNFFVTYANIDGFEPPQDRKVDTSSKNILDRWILSRLNQVVVGVGKFLDQYDAYNASGFIEGFVDDLSNWYIRRSRQRVGLSAGSEKDKKAFYQTSYLVLASLSEMLAPFLPYLSEAIYKNITNKESVHLASWPALEGRPDNQLVEEMTKIREIVEKAHSIRKIEKIPVRQPLAMLYTGYSPKTKGIENLLKEELNVKDVEWESGEVKGDNVKLDTKITPSLKEEAKTRELIRKIQKLRKKKGFKLNQKASVTSPWLPKNSQLVSWLKKRTLTSDLQKGDKLTVRSN
jgi:isoleucyl-tRNA synthetase